MIKTYVKKPVTVKACVWDGTNESELKEFCGDCVDFLQVQRADGIFTSCSTNTLEGRMTAEIGDYIIQGIKGEFYPCKPDIFMATYDLADMKE